MSKVWRGRGPFYQVYSSFFLVAVAGFLLSLSVASEDSRRQEPNAAERAMGAAATATGSAWETFRSWIKLGAMNLPSPSTARMSRSKSETVKEAAARSFEVGKSAAEESAKSAARVAETIVEKTASKVKRSASSTSAGKDEDNDL